MGSQYQKVKMKSILLFLFALLISISTIEAQRGRGTSAVFKIKSGRWARISNVPKQCCNKKRVITKTTLMQASSNDCQMLCPMLKVLKGCDFMCHFHLCYTSAAYGGTEAACRTQCDAVTDAPEVNGTDTGIGIEGIFSSKYYALKV